MKRYASARPALRLALVSVLVVVTFGCTKERRPETGADGELRSPARSIAVLLPPSERPFWEPIARSFEQDHPGTQVRLVEGPQATDVRENLYTASLLARDPSFDLVYMDVTWTPKFAAAGWLLPLDAHFVAEQRAHFLPAAIEAGIYRGRLYRIPVRTDVGVLYYRADLLQRAGRPPPRTLDEMVSAARALQSPPERWGWAWQGKQYEGLVCDFVELLAGHDGFWVDPATLDVGLDRSEAVDALSFLVASLGPRPISPPGVTTYQEEESRRLFQGGRAVFLRNWPYAWRLVQAEDSPVRGRVGVVPMPGRVIGLESGTLGGWGLGISAHSRSPDLALAFIRSATSLEGQRALCAPTGYAPARAEAYDDPELRAANPFLGQLREIHARAVPRPVIPRYALASDVLQRHLSAALAGLESPERALGNAARETRALLGSELVDGTAAGTSGRR